ncbi:hypothetical protein GCM10027586_04740 [Kineococcus gypseus]|uniref:hypothetical protein n=1 Tax=Kineococcus gypseus TaxID=1637102 RepID=UPI003D7C6E5F
MDTLLLSGTALDGAQWTLHAQDTPRGPGVVLDVRTASGRRCWGTAQRSTPLPPGQVIGGAWSRGEADEPTTWLIKLYADVRAVVVHLSDGTREDLRVVDDSHASGVRWAVLAHPPHLDVHRTDVYDTDGRALLDAAPA